MFPLCASLWPNGSAETHLMFAGGHVDAVVFCLQVNAVVLCRVVMVTVSSTLRRAKMLSPSSASKMQIFDLTWWDSLASVHLSVKHFLSLFCSFSVISFMGFILTCTHYTHYISHSLSHVSFLAKPTLINRDSVRDWEFGRRSLLWELQWLISLAPGPNSSTCLCVYMHGASVMPQCMCAERHDRDCRRQFWNHSLLKSAVFHKYFTGFCVHQAVFISFKKIYNMISFKYFVICF